MFKTVRTPAQSIVGVAGQRVSTDLQTGGWNRAHLLRLFGTINITVAATRVVNKGSIFGAWDAIGMNEAGRDIFLLDGRCVRAASEAYAPSALSQTRLAGTGVAATALVEAATLFCATPIDADPHGTVFREVDTKKKLQLFGQLRADGGQGGIVQGGTSSMTVVPQIQVDQLYDDLSGVQPDFLPFIRQDTIAVAAAQNPLTYYIQSPNAIRAILIQTEGPPQGEVGDILAGLAMRATGRDIIGPNQSSWDQLLRSQERDFGGAVYATGTSYGQSAYLFLNFAENGRLANVIPGTMPGLRFEFNAAPSAQAGVTSSIIRLTFFELERRNLGTLTKAKL